MVGQALSPADRIVPHLLRERLVMDYREGGGREASEGQNGDAGRLQRSKTQRTETVVRQTEKRKSGTRIAAECAKAAGANTAHSRAATIRSASSFREEFICLT
jgi:hypothetical protein